MGIKHYLMAKHLLSMSGNKLYEDEVEVTFAELYAMLLDSPGFVVLVYNDRAYHPTLVKGPTSGDNKWRVSFSSPIIDGVTTKTAEIECESSDGQVISKITTTAVNSENVSNKTDDIANNSTSSTRYPSTKGVADYVEGNYLPLTGGTLSGFLRFSDGYGQISGSSGISALRSDINKDGSGVQRAIAVQSNDELKYGALLQTFTDGEYEHSYVLFGEHNFAINANTSDYDMDVIIRSGEHFRWYITQGQTLNTPYKKGLTGAYIGALIMSYSNGTFGEQVAYIRGTGQVFIRNLDGNLGLTDWVELGGGLMSPTAVKTYKNSSSTATSVSGTGKGKIILYSMGAGTISNCVVDGKTLSNFSVPYDDGYLVNTHIEITFKQSFSFSMAKASASITFY